MRADNPGVLVIGGTGVLGQKLTRALGERGARVVITGRDAERTSTVADEVGANDHLQLDLMDVENAASVVDQAAEQLGGLDGVVIASGVAAFGPTVAEDDAVTEELFAINTFGPMAVIKAASPHLNPEAAVAVLTAVLVDVPTADMAAYSASKAALSTWLQVLRRELRRRKMTVLDARPPHMDTGLADRPIAGQTPKMPPAHDPDEVVALIVEGLYEGKSELVADLSDNTVTLR